MIKLKNNEVSSGFQEVSSVIKEVFMLWAGSDRKGGNYKICPIVV